MAVGALRSIKEAGFRVASDVAVVSIDDPPWAELTDPPLTTLAQPVRHMADSGRGAAARPARRHPQTAQAPSLPFELHHRVVL